MEKIILKSIRKIESVQRSFKRYLFERIDLKQRFIVIKGARGSGKTTLLLQLAKEKLNEKKTLYVSLDDLFFVNNTLYDFAEEFVLKGGQVLLLDEVHKYTNWSREIKLLYDDFSDLQIMFTSSSILDIYKGESDLSRRVVSYELKEMSFREFLEFQKNIKITSFSLPQILENHEKIALDLVQQFKPFQFFDEYLKAGAYPFYDADYESYQQKIVQTISLSLEVDLPAVENIDYATITKIKRLMFVLASNVPYTPNISKLSQQVDLTRNALINVLHLMEKANLIHTLYQQSKSISSMNKPDKIWLRNTNLMFALAGDKADKGTLRETFALQSLSNIHHLTLPKEGDLLVDQELIFEIGGKSKTSKQIAHLENAFLLKDDVEFGFGKSIPLWLLGFLY